MFLAYGEAAGLDTCFSLVKALHGASHADQYHCSRLLVSQPNPVYTSPPENLATLNKTGEVDFYNCGMILTFVCWLGPIPYLHYGVLKPC